MELNFLAFIGDGVNATLVYALGKEVTFRIVPAEEAEQVVINLALQRSYVHGVICELRVQLLHLRKCLRVRTERLGLANSIGKLSLQLSFIGGLIEGKRLLHLWQEVLIKELRHLSAL